MSIIRKDALETIRLANEVADLAAQVVTELDTESRWDHSTGKQVHRFDGPAPDHEYHRGGVTTAALRRRSLDLTRQLAKLRKGNWS